VFILIEVLQNQNIVLHLPINKSQNIYSLTKSNTMTTADLKKGSIVEIRLNLSCEQMNQPVQVQIDRCSEKYLWFKGNALQRMGRNTFNFYIQNFGYKIISI
jgi:hypothetical protein